MKKPAAPTAMAYNYYLNWVVICVQGMLREADALMAAHGSAIEGVAGVLRTQKKFALRPLYRGILLSPAEAKAGKVMSDRNVKSVSFSEDKDVACWFADLKSSVSGYVAQIRPGVRGYMMTHTPVRDEVLFHHSWTAIPVPDPSGRWREVPLEWAARQHPQIDARQFAWALRTQKEVIVRSHKALPIVPIEESGCAPADVLEKKLGPSFEWGP